MFREELLLRLLKEFLKLGRMADGVGGRDTFLWW